MFRLFGQNRKIPKVLVLGLDCASPDLVFDTFKDDLPNLRQLMDGGTWGTLKSSIPCITIPAWSSMMSSRDPGTLGVYGFRNRKDYSYDGLFVADNQAVHEPRVWDILSANDKQSIILNVPQTYPVKPLNGHLVAGFLANDTRTQFAYPAIFKQEVLKHFPDYAFDIKDFRNVERDVLLQQLIEIVEVQYDLLAYALTHKSWDFAMHVNIGVDRIHHTFWRYHDPEHRLYEADNPYKDVIRDYYKLVDAKIGQLLSKLDDNVAVMVVSDHGVKRMDGAVAINEWLWREGWLQLKEEPTSLKRITHNDIDWSKTRAWSTGGYYGRIFMNVEGREPQGIIPQQEYEVVRDELAKAIKAIPDDKGNILNNRIIKPEKVYQQVNNIAPDLMVYFGDLHWRTVGTIGYGQHFTLQNDTGPDDANHAEEGMFILHHPRKSGAGKIADRQLMDIAPTILDWMGVTIPDAMQGSVIE